jgi:plastocyanin
MIRFASRLIPIMLATGISACGNGPPTASSSGSGSPAASIGTVVTPSPGATNLVNVSVLDNSYSPAAINAKVGQPVVWTENGVATHNVKFDQDPNLASSDLSNKGDNFAAQFTAAGTYTFYCSYHKSLGMTGTITVS